MKPWKLGTGNVFSSTRKAQQFRSFSLSVDRCSLTKKGFMFQEPPLPPLPSRILTKPPRGRKNAMARDHDRKPVLPHRAPHRPGGARVSRPSRQFTVSYGRTRADGHEGAVDLLPEGRLAVEIQFNSGKRNTGVFEISLKALHGQTPFRPQSIFPTSHQPVTALWKTD